MHATINHPAKDEINKNEKRTKHENRKPQIFNRDGRQRVCNAGIRHHNHIGVDSIPVLCGMGFPLVVILVIEKDSVFVKRHAAQAMALYIVVAIIHIIFDIISAAIVFSLYSNPFGLFGAAGGAMAVSVISGIIGILLTLAAVLAR